MIDTTWRGDGRLDSEEFESMINGYELEARYSLTGFNSIREHFYKEIEFELSRLIDSDHKLDDAIRYRIVRVLEDNFDGAGIDISKNPTDADHERWENNLRKLFSAIFAFVENPSDLTDLAMAEADPQRSGEYND